MYVLLCILLSIVALICFLGGLNILRKGAMYFLPKEVAPQKVLDNLVRFLGGIYFSTSFLFIYVVFHIKGLGDLVYFLGIMVIFSGLGRLFSRRQVGSAGKYFNIIMFVEILLGLLIIITAWLNQI